MKIYRLSIALIFVTLLALLYVHQQVQLLKISYKIAANEKTVGSLLDQNRSLVYNITRLKSPVYLEEKFLASRKDFRVAQQWQVVEAGSPKRIARPIVVASNPGHKFSIFRIFGRPREALAKTIK